MLVLWFLNRLLLGCSSKDKSLLKILFLRESKIIKFLHLLIVLITEIK